MTALQRTIKSIRNDKQLFNALSVSLILLEILVIGIIITLIAKS